MIFEFLSQVLGIYSLLLVARIILTWFSHDQRSGIARFLSRATDPYLNLWRRLNLRAGFLDLAPIAALAALHVARSIFYTISAQGSITLGIILVILISAVWSMATFLLGFGIIVLVVRLIGFFMSREMHGMFWQIVDSIARPLMYRITRIIFRDRIVNFVTGIAVSIALLVAIWIIGGAVLRFVATMLAGN